MFIRFLSLSISGLILALILFSLKPFLKDRVSKTWQYYIWFIVILRLLVPYSPQTGIVEKLFQRIENTIAVEDETINYQNIPPLPSETFVSSESSLETESAVTPENVTYRYWNELRDNVWLLWIVVAFVLLVCKVVSYNKYIRYIKSDKIMLTDPDVIRIYKKISAEAGIKKQLNIYTNNKVVSPMLMGIIHPFIMLPNTKISEPELHNIISHELTHHKRLDIIYKWVTQITVCLHWFNPMVYFISKEINRNCELSCDEAIIKKLDADGKRQYGNTLLTSVKINENHGSNNVSLSLNEDAKLLKERLSSIMKFKKKTIYATVFTVVLTFTMFFCSILTGAFAMAAIPSDPLNTNLLMQNLKLPLPSVSDINTKTSSKTHPANAECTAIDSTKVTTINLKIDTAVVYLKTSNNDEFWLCYTGGANKRYKVSVNTSGSDKKILTIGIQGKTQEITSMMNLTELDSVTLEIPDKAYNNISIEDIKGNLSICEMNAPITVSGTNDIISLKQSEIERGSYLLKTKRGIINVETDSIFTKMNIENNHGIVNIDFGKEPSLGNFFFNIKDEKGSTNLPQDWEKYSKSNGNNLKDFPSLSILNHSGFTNVIFTNSTKDKSVLMKTATISKYQYYLVETEEDLRAIGSGAYSLSDNYMLNKNISLTKEWKAIGDDNTSFTGIFDGNGFTISNLTITDKKAKYKGLFGLVEGGTIHNLTLSNVDIDSPGGKVRGIVAIAVIRLDGAAVTDCLVK